MGNTGYNFQHWVAQVALGSTAYIRSTAESPKVRIFVARYYRTANIIVEDQCREWVKVFSKSFENLLNIHVVQLH